MNYAYNKHTGEKIYLSHGMFCFRRMGCKDLGDALEKGWIFGSEDFEPKEFWYIGQDGVIFSDTDTITQDYADRLEAIGNYFETEEQAEKAVEKLKAWKRLKDKGFRFNPVDRYEALGGNGFDIPIIATMPPEAYTDVGVSKDLDLLFGDEE